MATGDLRFDGRVVIVTGAGNGLGRAHALFFGSRGARVLVNDLGGGIHGGGRSSSAADVTAADVRAAGGEAIANHDSVEDGARIVQQALDTWGRVDVVVNNAGILRDTSFQKMTDEDWELVHRVHLLGAYRVTRAAWDAMRDAGYGRVVMTASAAGLYGNFGQANYAAAKLGLVGFASTLALEGRRRNVLVNTIAPIAGSRLTETVLPKELTDALRPEYVTPLVGYLCHESSTETGGVFEVGGGFFAKLRWERAKGKTVRAGRPITAELVRDAWNDVTSFDEGATHPADVAQSMAPILANVQAGPSKGGNAFIDVDLALGYEFPETTSSYDAKDLALYALAVGAGADPTNDDELALVYEHHAKGLRALPSFAVVPALNQMVKLAAEGKQAPGLTYGFDRVLHGEQRTVVHRPLPTSARLTHRTRVKDIWDKGKGAVVVTETRSFDEHGDELVVNEVSTYVRGAGGWGGERGPAGGEDAPPARAPDAVVTERIGANQALLYRLLGDWNPLHVDPSFAKAFGFERPILHGLCTYGYAGRHVARAFSANDPRFVRAMRARFADSVFPGETLETRMWKEGDRVVFECRAVERDKVVISNAACELWRELPAPRAARAAPPPAAAAATAATQGSRAIFDAIAAYVRAHPELPPKIATVFGFQLADPTSAWTLDMKAGGVHEGIVGAPDVTLALSEADFVAMSTGRADPQKLYFAGKLKLSGNLMAAQKLEFLKEVPAAPAAAAGGAPAASVASAAAPSPAATRPASADVFVAIEDHLARNPDLVGKIATVFAFKLSAPESAWTIDVKNGAGRVTPGAAASADVTLELAEKDFLDMTAGKADPQKLYFGGQLKISGNLMASQKLSFLKKIDPEQAKAAIQRARGAPAAAAAGDAATGAPALGASDAASGGASSPGGSAPRAASIFAAARDALARSPGLAGELGGAIEIVVTNPPAGAVFEGAGGARATVTIDDADLAALAAGTATAFDLYMHGKMRVDGDARLAQRLSFLKGARS